MPQPLFDDDVPHPDGFTYADDFLSREEETTLVERFGAMEFHEVRMRGVTARRRVIQYGWKYSFESFRMSPGPQIPDFLLRIRDRAAEFGGLEPPDLSEALVTEYAAGATIGWHRDAPGFGVVVGVSLLTPCRLRFRRGRTEARETTDADLQPRSIYGLTGPARTDWEHSIPALKTLRYSITFRTLTRTSRRTA